MPTSALATPAWLVSQLESHDIRIVDTRWYLTDENQGRREYTLGHIPGAIFLDLDTDLAGAEGPGRHPLPDRQQFAEMIGRAGIGNEHHAVVYDNGPGAIAARLWWMLRWVGHGSVSVLDGGYAAWTSAGFAISTAHDSYPSAAFALSTALTQTVDRNELLDSLGSVQLLDARAGERYRGEVEPVDPVGGHIPTAISAPTDGNLDGTGRFRSPQDLADRFVDLGVDPSERIVNSCGSGVTACHNILAMHIAGFPETALYPGSWSDWSTSRYPVTTGPLPGPPPTAAGS